MPPPLTITKVAGLVQLRPAGLHNQMKDHLKVKVVWLLALTALVLVLGVVEGAATEPVGISCSIALEPFQVGRARSALGLRVAANEVASTAQ
jgi:hypothetical protein